MPQQFNFNENSDSPAGQALIAAISFDKVKAVVEAQPEGRGTYEILFTCNGVELDFEAVMNRMDAAYWDDVMDAARVLVKKKAAEMVGAAHEIEDMIARKAAELFPEFDEEEEDSEPTEEKV